MKKLGIIGNGWLGKKLMKKALDNNVQVHVTNRSKKKNYPEGVHDYIFDLPKTYDKTFFDNSDQVVISLSPGNENFAAAIDILIKQFKRFKSIKKVVLWSTIGVYGTSKGYLDEDFPVAPERKRAQKMADAENKLKETLGKRLTVIRLGGLVGENRHPGRFFNKSVVIKRGNDRINLVHAGDAVNITLKVLNEEIEGELINVVAPFHPRKKSFYPDAIKSIDGEAPKINEIGESRIVISNVLSKGAYTFLYPDLSDWTLYSPNKNK